MIDLEQFGAIPVRLPIQPVDLTGGAPAEVPANGPLMPPAITLPHALAGGVLDPQNAPKPSRGLLDPMTAALLQAGFAGMAASGPSRTPVSLGQVMGQAGMAGLKTYASLDEQQREEERKKEAAAETKRVHDAQIQAQEALAKQRAAEVAKAERDAAAQARFQELIAAQSQNGQQPDEIGVLGAGIQSGAFGSKETIEFMSKVMERKAAREQRISELEMRIRAEAKDDERTAALQRELIQLRAQGSKDATRLAAALRNPQIVNSTEGVFAYKDGVLSPLTSPNTGSPLRPPSSYTVDRGKFTQGRALRAEFDRLPEVKQANDLEIRLKPVAEYGLAVAQGKSAENPTRDLELAKLYLAATHPKGDQISNLDQKALQALPNLPRRVYESVSAVINGRTLDSGVRADMLRTVTDRYKGLDAARRAKRSDLEKRAKAGEIPVEYIFGVDN